MKIIKITASFSKTVQVRQYEPVHFSASAEAELDAGDLLEKCQVNLMKIVKAQVDAQVEQLRAGKAAPAQDNTATATLDRREIENYNKARPEDIRREPYHE